MEWFYSYLLFFAEVITVVLAIITVLVFIISQRRKSTTAAGSLSIKDITQEYQNTHEIMQLATMSDAEAKRFNKEQKKSKKQQKKQMKLASKASPKSDDTPDNTAQINICQQKPICYILSFNGSIDAHEVEDLRQEVSAVLSIIKPEDEVMIKLESPGGVVHGYGLAASQLVRFRNRDIAFTAIVDKVAASGGYMMACTANKIIAAPFAIVGSIGVVAQIPNFHRLLKKNEIDVELQTAGQFKRTLTMFGENTEEGRQKFQQELEETHLLFKDFVQQNRPNINIDEVATGEHWFATQALEKGLVDEIGTSDDVILSRVESHRIIEVSYQRRKKLSERVAKNIVQGVVQGVERLLFKNSRTL